MVAGRKSARVIDEELKEIVETAYKQAIALLEENRELLDAIARELLKTEVIEGEMLQGLLDQVVLTS
jgi:cell division protease FtsH